LAFREGVFISRHFPKAATTLESVITAGNYSLVADYSIFEAEGENGAESVFEVQYSDVGSWLVVCNVVKECCCRFC
jgi:hypothetical protein